MNNLIAAFAAGCIFALVFDHFRQQRVGIEFVGRVFLLPFYALSNIANILLCLAVWLMTGQGFRIEQDNRRREKHSSFR